MKRESLEERIANQLRPPETPGFFDELWQRAEADARRRAKLWRFAAIALAAIAFTAASAAAVIAARSTSDVRAGAAKTVDRTLVCGMKTDLGNGLRVFARIDEPGAPADLAATTAGGLQLGGIGVFAVASRHWWVQLPNGKRVLLKAGYGFDDTVCQPASRIALAASGLPRLGLFSHATTDNLSLFCPEASAPMFVRMRVTVKDGVPISAQMAIRAGVHRHPLAYVDWAPGRFTAYGSSGCLQE